MSVDLNYKHQQKTYELLKYIEENGRMPRGVITKDGKQLSVKEMTEEEKKEINLYAGFRRSPENRILKKYAGRPIEDIPEEYREEISKLRKTGLGKNEKTAYEEIIAYIEENGRMPRGNITKAMKILSRKEMTEEEKNEIRLYGRFKKSRENKILKKYVGRQIEEIPEEYREKISKLRKAGLGIIEKPAYEEIIEYLEENGRMPRSAISKNGKYLSIKEMTKEEQNEKNLYARFITSPENKILKKYAGRPIEEVPEEYREKILKLRKAGLGENKKTEKTAYEEIIAYIEENGRMPRGAISKNGKYLSIKEMTKEEQNEKNLYARFITSPENKILKKYAGRPIEEVPEEYREKISELRKNGLGNEKSKLKQAKQNKDDAKIMNDKSKELEGQVSEELNKRGKKYGEEQINQI